MPFFNNLRLTVTGIASTSLIIMTALLPTGTAAATHVAGDAHTTPQGAITLADPSTAKKATPSASAFTRSTTNPTANPSASVNPVTAATTAATASAATNAAIQAVAATQSTKASNHRSPHHSTPTATSTPSSSPTTSTPTSTPTATPTTTTNTSSMPTGNLPGWTQTYAQDFNTNAAIGQFSTVYGSKLLGYNGFGDTSGNGTYAPNQVLSASNGSMDYYIHAASGKYLTAAPTPTGYTGQLYGKWTIRFRSDTVAGYKLAFLLWPDSNTWSDGEIDFPEGELGQSIGAYAHNVLGTPSTNAFAWNTGDNMNAWHTVSIEWTPTHLTYTIDGVSKTTTDKSAIPTKSMHFVMQAETDLNGVKPSTSVAGHIQVDWISIYKYTP